MAAQRTVELTVAANHGEHHDLNHHDLTHAYLIPPRPAGSADGSGVKGSWTTRRSSGPGSRRFLWPLEHEESAVVAGDERRGSTSCRRRLVSSIVNPLIVYARLLCASGVQRMTMCDRTWSRLFLSATTRQGRGLTSCGLS